MILFIMYFVSTQTGILASENLLWVKKVVNRSGLISKGPSISWVHIPLGYFAPQQITLKLLFQTSRANIQYDKMKYTHIISGTSNIAAES